VHFTIRVEARLGKRKIDNIKKNGQGEVTIGVLEGRTKNADRDSLEGEKIAKH